MPGGSSGDPKADLKAAVLGPSPGNLTVSAAATAVLDDKQRIIADKIALARAELAAIDAALARGYAKVNGTKTAMIASANATESALKSREYAKLRDLRKRLEATFG